MVLMNCVRYVRRNSKVNFSFSFLSKANYSRRSDKNTSSFKVIESNRESLDDVDNASFGTNSNWELLTPRGFRFYLPGSVGPGWLNASTIAPVKTQFVNVSDTQSFPDPLDVHYGMNVKKQGLARPILYCLSQECPILLRKGIQELFPGCLDVNSPQLTIVTISQKTNLKNMRWSKELETEKFAKYFVLAASDICMKLKFVGYWADFINPFSGQPHLSPQKNKTLYQTDERFRCLGFKIQQKKNCKIISYDTNDKNFIGSLYTTAPASTEFLRDILNDINSE